MIRDDTQSETTACDDKRVDLDDTPEWGQPGVTV